MILEIHCQTLLISKFHPTSCSESVSHHGTCSSRKLCSLLQHFQFGRRQTFCRYSRVCVSCNPSKYRINLLMLYNSNFVCKSEKPIIWVMCRKPPVERPNKCTCLYTVRKYTFIYQIHTVRHYTVPYTRCNVLRLCK